VQQMDKVTQANASNAEETASASEELNAHADTLKETVVDLVALVRDGSLHTSASYAGAGGGKTSVGVAGSPASTARAKVMNFVKKDAKSDGRQHFLPMKKPEED